jgi:hypothetical protein
MRNRLKALLSWGVASLRQGCELYARLATAMGLERRPW